MKAGVAVLAYLAAIASLNAKWCVGVPIASGGVGSPPGEDPPFDHQYKTYTPQFTPVSKTGGLSVAPFFSPDHSIDTITNLINSAKSTIDIGTPGFSSWIGCTPWSSEQEVGCQAGEMRNETFPVFSALVNALHRGVKVRMVTNNYNQPDSAGLVGPLSFLSMNGAEIRYFASLTFYHSKYVCVDGQVASVTSVNYSRTSFMKNREAGALVQGSAAIEFLQRVFDFDFDIGTPFRLDQNYNQSVRETVTSKGDLPVIIPHSDMPSEAYVTSKPVFQTVQGDWQLFTSPDSAFDTMTGAINAAKNTLFLHMYQITEDKLVDTLLLARSRGVNVTILVSHNIYDDNDWAMAKVCYAKLRKAGQVIHTTPTYYSYSHQKYWIVDGKSAGWSTGNWSPSDYPLGSSFPTYGSAGWQKTNRDYTFFLHDEGVASVFYQVASNDLERGGLWYE